MNIERKTWRENLEMFLTSNKVLSPNHINCYVDAHKNTSKAACSYIFKSYNLTNVYNIAEISEIPGEGINFIYSKNVAFRILTHHQNCKGNYIFMDNSYFSKFYDEKIAKFRMIVNHIHPQKTISNYDGEKIELSPWNTSFNSDSFILICPPTGNILKLYGIKDSWLEGTIKQIRKKTDRKILIRFKNYDFFNEEKEKFFKKLNHRHKNIFYQKEISDADLLKLFQDCYAVVAPASGVGVIAASKGIPVFSEKFGPVASISLHDYSLINEPIFPDREEWLSTILSHEFTLQEIFNGKWLPRLKSIYPKELKRILDGEINIL